jgi:hypothetical protein
MLEDMLAELEQARLRFGEGEGPRTAALISALSRERFSGAASLVRFHEALLFLRAYPASREVAREADLALASVAERARGIAGLDEPEISGIAGTAFSAVFSYDVARRLASAFPSQIDVDWEGYDTARLANWLSPAVPLIEEDSSVEAHVPYLDWLRAAKPPHQSDLAWLLDRVTPAAYQSLELPLRWELGDSEVTRTRARIASGRPLFLQTAPLIPRRDVSVAGAVPDLPIERLSQEEGESLIARTEANSATRYRELYGFTYGDPAHVVRADAGRGVTFYVWGVPPGRRLPLRAYHCGVIARNDVPVGYVETLTLFERMEVGFNIYYTFREGESAWTFARLLRFFGQLMPVSCFSVDPYQVGHLNEEAIESGAFWFYRKLGFRPVEPGAARLLAREEKRIAGDPGYRTPPARLRKLAAGYMLYGEDRTWDRFRVRNLGLAAARRMAERFAGSAEEMRRSSIAAVSAALGIEASLVPEGWAAVLSLIPGLEQWSAQDKHALAAILRAKSGSEEIEYVRLMTRHAKLRQEVAELGSAR